MKKVLFNLLSSLLVTSLNAQNNVEYYEYWFESDYASKVSGTLASNQYVNYADLIAITGLLNGLHIVHIRFQDETGKWSSVLSQFFLK